MNEMLARLVVSATAPSHRPPHHRESLTNIRGVADGPAAVAYRPPTPHIQRPSRIRGLPLRLSAAVSTAEHKPPSRSLIFTRSRCRGSHKTRDGRSICSVHKSATRYAPSTIPLWPGPSRECCNSVPSHRNRPPFLLFSLVSATAPLCIAGLVSFGPGSRRSLGFGGASICRRRSSPETS
jgi:hypothetical protein